MTTKVKICGITRREDLEFLCQAGADFVGFIVGAEHSPRNLPVALGKELIRSAPLPTVLVTQRLPLPSLVSYAETLQPSIIQIHDVPDFALVRELADELYCALWQALPIPPIGWEPKGAADALATMVKRLADAGCRAVVLDTAKGNQFGGTGIIGNWQVAAILIERSELPCVLAGGLNPDNVQEAIAVTRPWCVDVSSGVESKPGIKDHRLISDFIRRAKRAHQGI